MTRTNIRLASAAIATLLMLGTAHVSAQPQAAQQQPPAQTQQAAPQFGDEQVERFAQSFGEIIEIRERFTAELQKVSSSDEAKKLQQKANDEMVSVIEDSGITVQEYNSIAQAMQTDPQLRDKVAALMQ